MGPQLLQWHSQCQGSARAQAPNGEVRGGYPADCIAPASPDHNTKVTKVVFEMLQGVGVGDQVLDDPLPLSAIVAVVVAQPVDLLRESVFAGLGVAPRAAFAGDSFSFPFSPFLGALSF